MNRCFPPVLFAVFLLLSLVLSPPAAPLSAQGGDPAGPGPHSAANPPAPGGSQVVNISFAGDEQLAELTARLDPLAATQIRRYIHRLAEGRTMLLCTHNLAEGAGAATLRALRYRQASRYRAGLLCRWSGMRCICHRGKR